MTTRATPAQRNTCLRSWRDRLPPETAEECLAKKQKVLPFRRSIEERFVEHGLDPTKKNELIPAELLKSVMHDVSRDDIANRILMHADEIKKACQEEEATYKCLRDPTGWRREGRLSPFTRLHREAGSYSERSARSSYMGEGERMGNCEFCFATGPLGRSCRNVKCASQILDEPFSYKVIRVEGSTKYCCPRALCVLVHGHKTATPFCRAYPLITTSDRIFCAERRERDFENKVLVPIQRILEAMEQDPRNHFVELIETTGVNDGMLHKAIMQWDLVSDLHQQEHIVQGLAIIPDKTLR